MSITSINRAEITSSHASLARQQGADENEVEQATVYRGDERGYTDYPFLQG